MEVSTGKIDRERNAGFFRWYKAFAQTFLALSSVKAVFGVGDVAVAEMKLGTKLPALKANPCLERNIRDRSRQFFRLPIRRTEHSMSR